MCTVAGLAPTVIVKRHVVMLMPRLRHTLLLLNSRISAYRAS